DGFRSLVLQRCYAAGGKDGDPNLRILRLRRGASKNIIRDNYFIGLGVPIGEGLSSGDQIEIESGCAVNQIQNNLSARNLENGVFVNFAGKPVPTERTQIIGQRQVLSYSPVSPPVTGWKGGDIVINTDPTPGGFVGWVLVPDPNQAGQMI